METLQVQIKNFREKFKTMVSTDKVETIEKALKNQKLNRGLEGITKVGDIVSDFSVVDIDGKHVRLFDLLETGPVVLKFYRGGWCPYCNLELMAFQNLADEFKKEKVTILALSPESMDEVNKTVDHNQLKYPVGTDEELRIGKSFGLVFELDQDLRELYTKFNHPLSKINTKGLWELPVPGTFVIGQDKKVSFASVNLDYRERTEPLEVLEHVKRLSK